MVDSFCLFETMSKRFYFTPGKESPSNQFSNQPGPVSPIKSGIAVIHRFYPFFFSFFFFLSLLLSYSYIIVAATPFNEKLLDKLLTFLFFVERCRYAISNNPDQGDVHQYPVFAISIIAKRDTVIFYFIYFFSKRCTSLNV